MSAMKRLRDDGGVDDRGCVVACPALKQSPVLGPRVTATLPHAKLLNILTERTYSIKDVEFALLARKVHLAPALLHRKDALLRILLNEELYDRLPVLFNVLAHGEIANKGVFSGENDIISNARSSRDFEGIMHKYWLDSYTLPVTEEERTVEAVVRMQERLVHYTGFQTVRSIWFPQTKLLAFNDVPLDSNDDGDFPSCMAGTSRQERGFISLLLNPLHTGQQGKLLAAASKLGDAATANAIMKAMREIMEKHMKNGDTSSNAFGVNAGILAVMDRISDDARASVLRYLLSVDYRRLKPLAMTLAAIVFRHFHILTEMTSNVKGLLITKGMEEAARGEKPYFNYNFIRRMLARGRCDTLQLLFIAYSARDMAQMSTIIARHGAKCAAAVRPEFRWQLLLLNDFFRDFAYFMVVTEGNVAKATAITRFTVLQIPADGEGDE